MLSLSYTQMEETDILSLAKDQNVPFELNCKY